MGFFLGTGFFRSGFFWTGFVRTGFFGQAFFGQALGATLGASGRRAGPGHDRSKRSEKRKGAGFWPAPLFLTLYIQNSILGGANRKGFRIYSPFVCYELAGFA